MKKFLIYLFFLSGSSFYAQDTIYLDKNAEKTFLKEEAVDYKVLLRDAENPDLVVVRRYHDNGNLASENPYSSFEEKTAHGAHRTWFENGQLRSEIEYINNRKHGTLTTYWENGQKKREDHYKKGKWKEGTTWDQAGDVVPHYEFEIHPVFPGGKKALVKYLQKNARKPKGVKGGKVKVGFVIDVDGNIVEARIEESSSLDLNWAAYDLVRKMPAWQPGQVDGQKVRVKYTLPINFQ